MPISEQLEWERPDPNSEPDPEEIIIPKVPHDDDVLSDSEDTDSDDDQERDEDED